MLLGGPQPPGHCLCRELETRFLGQLLVTVPQCAPVAAGGYRGQPNGLEAGDAGLWGPKASRLGPQVFAKNQPSYFMTYAEYAFIKAEAAERGWITGSAAQFYADGITASMAQWGRSSSISLGLMHRGTPGGARFYVSN